MIHPFVYVHKVITFVQCDDLHHWLQNSIRFILLSCLTCLKFNEDAHKSLVYFVHKVIAWLTEPQKHYYITSVMCCSEMSKLKAGRTTTYKKTNDYTLISNQTTLFDSSCFNNSDCGSSVQTSEHCWNKNIVAHSGLERAKTMMSWDVYCKYPYHTFGHVYVWLEKSGEFRFQLENLGVHLDMACFTCWEVLNMYAAAEDDHSFVIAIPTFLRVVRRPRLSPGGSHH